MGEQERLHENLMMSVDERIEKWSTIMNRRIRYIEGIILTLSEDIGQMKGQLATMRAKLAVEAREEHKTKGIKIEDVLQDMIKKGKAVDVTDVISSDSPPSNYSQSTEQTKTQSTDY